MSEKREYTCIVCPNGCTLQVETEEGDKPRFLSVRGNLCPRGAAWAKQEVEDPRRTISTNVALRGGTLPVVSVRTLDAVPLADIMKLRQALRKVVLQAPVHIGQIAAVDPGGVKCRVAVTRNVPAAENIKR